MSGYGPVRGDDAQHPFGQGPYGAPAEEVTTLWIGNCLPGTTDESLAVQMVPYGDLIACFLLKSLSPQGQMSGFVRYRTREQAAAALDAITSGQVLVNQSIISGKFASRNSSELKDQALAAQQKAIIQSAYIEASMGQTQQPKFAQLPGYETGQPKFAPLPGYDMGLAASLPGYDAGQSAALSGYDAGYDATFDAAATTLLDPGAQTGIGQMGAAEALIAAVGGAQSLAQLEALQNALNELSAQPAQPAQPVLSQQDLQQILSQTIFNLKSQVAAPDYGEEITTLWIGNCLPNTTDADVAASMSQYGQLVSCFLMKKLSPQGQMSGFVRYSSRQQASFALDHIMNGQAIVKGSAISGKWATKNSKPLSDPALAASQAAMLAAASSTGLAPTPPPSATPVGDDITTLWVGNVPFGTTNEVFQAALAPLGEMVCCFLHKKLSPQGQMSGYARFNTKQEAATALQCFENGMLLISGVILKAKWARQNGVPMNAPQ